MCMFVRVFLMWNLIMINGTEYDLLEGSHDYMPKFNRFIIDTISDLMIRDQL